VTTAALIANQIKKKKNEHQFTLVRWVAGHAGNEGNEMAILGPSWQPAGKAQTSPVIRAAH